MNVRRKKRRSMEAIFIDDALAAINGMPASCPRAVILEEAITGLPEWFILAWRDREFGVRAHWISVGLFEYCARDTDGNRQVLIRLAPGEYECITEEEFADRFEPVSYVEREAAEGPPPEEVP